MNVYFLILSFFGFRELKNKMTEGFELGSSDCKARALTTLSPAWSNES